MPYKEMPTRTEKILEGVEALRQAVPMFAAKVHPFYVLLGWTWGSREQSHVPSEAEITDTLHGLLTTFYDAAKDSSLEDKTEWRTSTGGLEVGFCVDEFFLGFVVEHDIYVDVPQIWGIEDA